MTTRNTTYRFASGVAVGAAFILVWLSLGVGIIGRDGDPANLMYFGVLAVGIIGTLIARFRPGGMARADRHGAGSDVGSRDRAHRRLGSPVERTAWSFRS